MSGTFQSFIPKGFKEVSLAPFHVWGNWGPDDWSDLLQTTQQARKITTAKSSGLEVVTNPFRDTLQPEEMHHMLAVNSRDFNLEKQQLFNFHSSDNKLSV